MRMLAFNLFVILVVGSPLILFELLRAHSKWIDEHHEGLSFVVWFFTLAAVYFWLLPMLGLGPNWRVLAP
jgi:hypothetical protein